MNIGQASDATGLPAKTIRYYEDISLIKPARATNGYRDYDGKDVHRLALIQRSRSLGFTIEECRVLLSLYDDEHRASADVRAVVVRGQETGEFSAELDVDTALDMMYGAVYFRLLMGHKNLDARFGKDLAAMAATLLRSGRQK